MRAYAGDAFAGWQFLEPTYPTLIHQIRLALNYLVRQTLLVGNEMEVTQLYIARHLLAVICGLIGMVLLAIGAHAALDLHTSDAKAVSTEESASANRIALIIGNGHYPDSAEPLNQPINDASGLADAMRRHGFDVDVVEDATKADMARAVERLRSRIKPGSVVMLIFGGYGVQAGHESYMIPTDATIWKESDVRGGRPRPLGVPSALCRVRFSNRPFEVKHFQTIRHCSIDVAHGLALLFGIGTRALPSWDSRMR